MDLLSAFSQDISQFFSSDPSVFGVQLIMLSFGGLVVFLVLFAARDSMQRTESFIAQLFSIVLVAALPGLGFLMYLLLRPATTIRERQMEQDIASVLSKIGKHHGKGRQQRDKEDSKE